MGICRVYEYVTNGDASPVDARAVKRRVRMTRIGLAQSRASDHRIVEKSSVKV